MENTFAQDAFNKAQEALEKDEARYYTKFAESRESASYEVTAIFMAGVKEMASLIELASEHGLIDTLHNYAKYEQMAGFKAGFSAGRESILNNQ